MGTRRNFAGQFSRQEKQPGYKTWSRASQTNDPPPHLPLQHQPPVGFFCNGLPAAAGSLPSFLVTGTAVFFFLLLFHLLRLLTLPRTFYFRSHPHLFSSIVPSTSSNSFTSILALIPLQTNTTGVLYIPSVSNITTFTTCCGHTQM